MSDSNPEEVIRPTSDKSTLSEPGDTPPQSPDSPLDLPGTANTNDTEDTIQPSEDCDEAAQRQHARAARGAEFYGQVHLPPRPGDPKRREVFVQSTPIPDNEKKDIVEKWKASMAGGETSEPTPMGDHLRPSTPPTERVTKVREQLRGMGTEVNAEMHKTIFDQFTGNSGLYTSLQEYSADKKDIPVEHARELVRQMDRLKVESSDQSARQNLITSQLRSQVSQLEEQIKQLEEEKQVQSRDTAMNLPDDQSEASGFQTKDIISDELIATRENLALVRKEREELKAFSEFFYKELKQEREKWAIFIKANASSEENVKRMPKETRNLVIHIFENLQKMERKYLLGWPGTTKALKNSSVVARDVLTNKALEEAKKSLLRKLVDVMDLTQKLHELQELRDKHLYDIGKNFKKQDMSAGNDALDSCNSQLKDTELKIQQTEQSVQEILHSPWEGFREQKEVEGDQHSAKSSPFIWGGEEDEGEDEEVEYEEDDEDDEDEDDEDEKVESDRTWFNSPPIPGLLGKTPHTHGLLSGRYYREGMKAVTDPKFPIPRRSDATGESSSFFKAPRGTGDADDDDEFSSGEVSSVLPWTIQKLGSGHKGQESSSRNDIELYPGGSPPPPGYARKAINYEELMMGGREDENVREGTASLAELLVPSFSEAELEKDARVSAKARKTLNGDVPPTGKFLASYTLSDVAQKNASAKANLKYARIEITNLKNRVRHLEQSLQEAQSENNELLHSISEDEEPQLRTLSDLLDGPETAQQDSDKGKEPAEEIEERLQPNLADSLNFFNVQYMLHVRMLILESLKLGARKSAVALFRSFDFWFYSFKSHLAAMSDDVLWEIDGSRQILKAYGRLWLNGSPERARGRAIKGLLLLRSVSEPYLAETYINLANDLERAITAFTKRQGEFQSTQPSPETAQPRTTAAQFSQFPELIEGDIQRWRDEESQQNQEIQQNLSDLGTSGENLFLRPENYDSWEALRQSQTDEEEQTGTVVLAPLDSPRLSLRS